ncbi:MAG: hypothetical protein OEY59_00615 [Deltaproteobacteria bacterium]|nr:hypothetical protein [Deltaproteobacteria bacterium]
MNKLKSWIKQHPLWVLLIVSAVLHLIVISSINLKQWINPPTQKTFEVDLVEKQKSLSKPAKSSVAVKKAPPQPEKEVPKKDEISKIPPAKPTLSLRSKLTSQEQLEGLVSGTPPNEIKQEQIAIQPEESRIVLDADEKSKADIKALIIKKPEKSTSPITGVNASQVKGKRNKSIPTPQLIDKSSSLIKNAEKTPSGISGGKKTSSKSDSIIEGEVSKRKIISKPKPPKLNLDKDVTISLKFTVLSNGEVDQIIPFIKADSELERLATRLLRLYRFEPLFDSENTQNGIIHFTIKRKN